MFRRAEAAVSAASSFRKAVASLPWRAILIGLFKTAIVLGAIFTSFHLSRVSLGPWAWWISLAVGVVFLAVLLPRLLLGIVALVPWKILGSLVIAALFVWAVIFFLYGNIGRWTYGIILGIFIAVFWSKIVSLLREWQEVAKGLFIALNGWILVKLAWMSTGRLGLSISTLVFPLVFAVFMFPEMRTRVFWRRAMILIFGWMGNSVINAAFDYGLYPFLINRYGEGLGWGMAFIASFISCWVSFILYDSIGEDLLGFESIRSGADQEKNLQGLRKTLENVGGEEARAIRKTREELRRDSGMLFHIGRFIGQLSSSWRVVMFVVASLKWEPFMTTILIRRGASYSGVFPGERRYVGLGVRDWGVFLSSLIIGNLSWGGAVIAGLRYGSKLSEPLMIFAPLWNQYVHPVAMIIGNDWGNLLAIINPLSYYVG